mmetsp:Transcript_52861/g.57370  ORF Transcript_52861/g.57370 Transcript_52861/m.57370 type:complete len:607 (+) Transcript_52861:58-1878(+)
MSFVLERTTKKQKSNTGTVEFNDTRSGNSIHASFSLLVEKFSQIQLTDIEDFLEIISKIQSHRYLLEFDSNSSKQDVKQYLGNTFHYKQLVIHKLHSTLILHLGFLLGSLKKQSFDRKRRHEVFSSLVFCLRDIYINDHVNLSRFTDGDEFEEVFVLIPQISENYSVDIIDKRHVSQACYQIMRSWLTAPVLLKKFLTKSKIITFENFIFSVLKSTGKKCIAIRNGEQIFDEILEPLRLICDKNSEFQKLLDVAILAVQSRPVSSYGYLSHRQTIFYWRCIYRIGWEPMVTNPRLEIADCAVDAMISYRNNMITDRFLLSLVMTCIGEFIQEVTAETNMRVMQFVAFVLQKNHKDENLFQILECFSSCMSRTDAAEKFLRMEEWEKIFDILVCIATDHHDTDTAENATLLVTSILKSLLLSNQPPSVLVLKSIEVLSVFVSLQNSRIVERTLDLVFLFSANSKILNRVASTSTSPDLICALALIAPRNIIDEEGRIKLAHTFSLLIHEMKNIHFLARQAPILAFLVLLAKGSYCETESRGQEISVFILNKLARNSCNRRMLAKEPGLISSLIRYARTTTENVDVPTERNISRNEMKELIFLLARAL